MMSSWARWMASGAAAFTITTFVTGPDLYKAAIAQVREMDIITAHNAVTDGHGNPADWDIATDVGPSHPTTTPFPEDEARLAIGDRLKVSVYEKIGSDSERSSTPLLSTLAEHAEVSGEYTVQTDGTIYLPFVGQIGAAEQTRDGLQQALERKIASVFKGQAAVTVRLEQREPIYVTGNVRQPGTFKYTPGMMVLNAVILAGSMLSEKENWQRVDLMRMAEHLQQTGVQLANLLAQRDVLIAARNGKKPTPSPALLNLAGQSRAMGFITAAAALADLKDKKYENEQQALLKDSEMLEKERTSLTEGLNDARTALEHAKSRMEDVTKLHKTGMTTDSSYYEAVGELETARSRWNDSKTALARLERQIVEIGERQKKSVVEAEIAREQAISDLEASIAKAEVTRATLQPALTLDGTDVHKTEMPQYRILRATSSGMKRIEADRFSFLRPGDIVEAIRNVRPSLGIGADLQR